MCFKTRINWVAIYSDKPFFAIIRLDGRHISFKCTQEKIKITKYIHVSAQVSNMWRRLSNWRLRGFKFKGVDAWCSLNRGMKSRCLMKMLLHPWFYMRLNHHHIRFWIQLSPPAGSETRRSIGVWGIVWGTPRNRWVIGHTEKISINKHSYLWSVGYWKHAPIWSSHHLGLKKKHFTNLK